MRTVKISSKGRRSFLSILGTVLFFIAIPLILVILAHVTMNNSKRHHNQVIATSGESVHGQITQIVLSGGRSSAFRIMYDYKFAGVAYHGMAITEIYPKVKVGEGIEIRVLSESPKISIPLFILDLDQVQETQGKRATLYVALGGVGVVGLIGLLIFRMMFLTYTILKKGEVQDASIIKIELGGRNSRPIYAVVQLTNSAGQTVRGRIPISSEKTYQVGSLVKVAYLQKVPNKIIELPNDDFDVSVS